MGADEAAAVDAAGGPAPRPSWATLAPRADSPADPSSTVLDVLVERFPHVGPETWRQRFARGLVLDEQRRPLAVSAPAAEHRRVAYFREVAGEAEWPAPVAILHADERLVVADKPPFQPVVPSGPFVRRCLLYLVERQLGVEGLHPVHRLDRATSGLVLLARDRATAAAYGGLFAAGEVEREYAALATVRSPPAEVAWDVASRLVAGEPFFRMREVPGTPNARTRIELVVQGGGLGRFRLRPSTGKKHQLRIHLASLGLSILGDRFYPRLLPEAPDDVAHPLRLVAVGLAFDDPFDGRRRSFASSFRPETLAPLPSPADG
ncbi:MAG TPA: pseudouridine synthase [Thermoanaerobaculia bacterium]|nr:pseudouridine synthase [Thermoanaerobaculia bacterium]